MKNNSDSSEAKKILIKIRRFCPNPSEAKKRFGGCWIENPLEVFNV